MTNKQELRVAAEKHGDDDILALLDDLEAKDKQISDLKEAFHIALSAAGIDVERTNP